MREGLTNPLVAFQKFQVPGTALFSSRLGRSESKAASISSIQAASNIGCETFPAGNASISFSVASSSNHSGLDAGPRKSLKETILGKHWKVTAPGSFRNDVKPQTQKEQGRALFDRLGADHTGRGRAGRKRTGKKLDPGLMKRT